MKAMLLQHPWKYQLGAEAIATWQPLQLHTMCQRNSHEKFRHEKASLNLL
jgi:hypothetical protein